MGKRVPQSKIVHNETEFYLTVVRFEKPIIIKPLQKGAFKEQVLTEIECKALINFNQTPGLCQCSPEKFPPDYPFIVEEYREEE